MRFSIKSFRALLYFLILLSPGLAGSMEISKVIIWGHKLHTHTHSYIHYGFFKAFKELGFDTYWFDDSDFPNSQEFSYANALIFTAYAVDTHVPQREDCYYVYHHCWNKEHNCAKLRYPSQFEKKRCISIKCFWVPYLEDDPEWIEIDKFIYKSYTHQALTFPWATDLLPKEIDREILQLSNSPKSKQTVSYIGTISSAGYGANLEQLTPFFIEAKKNGYKVFTNDPWSHPLSNEDHKLIIQTSRLSPSIQGRWQADVGYIPCRIFKNISYGALGITNSKYVQELFQDKLVYNEDEGKLFYEAEKALKIHTNAKQIELMNFVKESHTYLNRATLILNFLKELENEN